MDDDAAHTSDYDGGLRAAAEGGRVAMFRGPARGPAADRPASAPPAADVDSPFLGLFDDPPGGRPRDRVKALEPGSNRPISGIPVSAAPSSGAGRAPEDLRAPKRVVPRTEALPAAGYERRQLDRPPVERQPIEAAPPALPSGADRLERSGEHPGYPEILDWSGEHPRLLGRPGVAERRPGDRGQVERGQSERGQSERRQVDRGQPERGQVERQRGERQPAQRQPDRSSRLPSRPSGGSASRTPAKSNGKVVPGREIVPPARRNPQDAPGPSQRPVRNPPTTKPGKRTPLDRTPKPRHKDRQASIDLAITEIAGHLTFTPNTVTAWYWLPEVRWAFRPDAEREALLSAISEQYAGLAGFRLHLRRTTKPFPADQWARVVDNNTPFPLPSAGAGPSWADHLVAAQKHLLAINHAEGQTYLGISFARRTLGDTFAERIGSLFRRGVADAERRRMARTVEQFDEVLGAFGMRGRRVTAFELEWLLYRSVALCMSPPGQITSLDGGWDRGDLLALTEQVERYRTPYGSTVKLVNRVSGEERHVAVLTVGRMEPLEIPERHEPWLHFHERLPWPMELSSRIDILGPNDSFRNLEHRLRLIRSQQADYSEHGIDAPPELERLAKRALTIGDEISTGLPVDSSRAHGWHRIAVGGRTREECLERARRVTQMYSREMRVALQHPKQQDWLAREFIPGEPLANTGYLRRMPVKLFAAALPQAASTVGDRRGDLIGRTAGTSRRPVFLDLHFPMEVRERSGLAVFVAEPGGGKSTLMGALGYLNARRGVQVTLLDPSGPLARLCAMPELAPYSRVLNLTGSEQGTLAPYSLIPTPQRGHYVPGSAGDREFEIAISNARAERRMLVQDICMMLVPPQVAREASTATMLRHAVRQVPAEESSTLEDVIRSLRDTGDHDALELGNLLLDTAEMPLAMLFFGTPPPGLLGADATLTVITMAGLRLPDLKIEREYWSAEESLALPMLHTAHRLAVRRCYGGDMTQRKLVGLDEAHFMEGWRSGRSFLVRLARDSRKWNLAALVASQNPKDILGLDVQNLVSTVFVGRIAEDSEIAAEALRLLRVPTDVGYEQTLAALSQVDTSSSSRLGFREFVMRDVDGRVQKVRVDVSYVRDLLRYLDTTPGGVHVDGAVGGEVVDIHDDDPEVDR
ncbi:ATP-binding protein [Dactylosporangium sp. NBC_01737]|uniref:ATP-binding protein n=1 Tax=Dactylosporangium sp. NBC_01737 TaxID=2975959 RepID=UPI002E0E04CD|nr:ATP-binding protein [Dactylosporangium sp. NBC_01737]